MYDDFVPEELLFRLSLGRRQNVGNEAVLGLLSAPVGFGKGKTVVLLFFFHS